MAFRPCPGASTVPAGPSLWGVAGVGNVSGVWMAGVVFGALLGPEATGPAAMQIPLGFLVFLALPSMHVSVWGAGDGVVV